ncbi:MAG: universal stress protein [Anaerolineae bacterium]|nr:universal stress protein [Anaerolineae bacterium]MBT3711871.1 universal stress protein [Anaerolineae bacterium]MBT4311121.1 universal stress protein [Anaerolineae bacterium]MBT4459382.1 universal stress protein [Anaerolineae bacterium]MBT4841284.1 universal stress protein [Anaerolineae bacterium]
MIIPMLCTLNILLADDGSKHSQAAVQLLEDLRLDEESCIMALRVFTPTDTSKVWAIENALEVTVEKLKNQGKCISSKLLLGHPAETIIEVAKNHQASMIVIGAKGLRATLGILLGGVVQQVTEHAQRPILVVRAPYTGLKRVLLTVDGSEESNKMLHCIGDFPFPADTKFDILHISPPVPSEQELMQLQYQTSTLDASYIVPIDKIREETKKRAKREEEAGKKILADARKNLQEKGIDAQISLISGDGATEIIHYAKDQDIDLIVCGGRGLGPVRSWILGSVSRKLLHYAPCSVLVVKGNDEDA